MIIILQILLWCIGCYGH